MKCSHCGAQLPETETPRYCIYCGRPLEGPGKDGGLESVLAEIRERFGLDALRDGQRAVAYLADLTPGLKKEQRLLKLLFESGADKLLFEAAANSGGERETKLARARWRLTEEYWLSESAAEMVCDAFLYALCPEAARPKQKPAAQPARKPVSPLPTPPKPSGSPAATPEPWRKTPKPKKLTMTDKGVEMDGTVLAVTITIFCIVAAFLFNVIICVIK